jgi:hypothetical protein
MESDEEGAGGGEATGSACGYVGSINMLMGLYHVLSYLLRKLSSPFNVHYSNSSDDIMHLQPRLLTLVLEASQ